MNNNLLGSTLPLMGRNYGLEAAGHLIKAASGGRVVVGGAPSEESLRLEGRLRDFADGYPVFSIGSPRDINSVGSFISVAIRVLSFLSGMFSSSASPPSSDPSPTNKPPTNRPSIDRIDSPSDSLDIAMGTLMAFGGKYLRRTAVWLFDQIENNPDILPQDKVGTAGDEGGGYLGALSPSDLEELATSAVAAGANPLKLQEAFIKATNSGDWSDLEAEISSALGPEAVGGSSIGGSSPLGSLSNLFSGILNPSSPSATTSNNGVSSSSVGSGVSQSTVDPTSSSNTNSSGPFYYIYQVQDTINRIDKVISAEPDPADPTTSTVLNRFVKEFHLEKEALAMQTQLNGMIRQVNTFLGEEESESSSSPAVHSNLPATNSGPTSSSSSSVSQAYTLFGYSIPNPLGLFDSGGSGGDSANKEVFSASPGGASSSSSSVAAGGLNPLFLGMFGVLAALGTVAVGSYVSSAESKVDGSGAADVLFQQQNSINKVDYAPLHYEYLPSDIPSSSDDYSPSSLNVPDYYDYFGSDSSNNYYGNYNQ